MTIMQDTSATERVDVWTFEEVGGETVRSTCFCGWTGLETARRTDAYLDWEQHQESAHRPDLVACPEWCQEERGHGWRRASDEWTRFHRRSFGHVAIAQYERYDGAKIVSDTPSIEFDNYDVSDCTPEEAEQLAACLSTAASYLRDLLAVTA